MGVVLLLPVVVLFMLSIYDLPAALWQTANEEKCARRRIVNPRIF